MNRPEIEDVIRRALTEDLAAAGDITTQAAVAEHIHARAQIVARAAGTVAGLDVARQVFHTIEATIEWTPHVTDGTAVPAGSVLAELQGPARPILTGERTALNLLAHLSGIATATADLVLRVAGTGARIVDTRKTTPGLRALDKYAVRTGGGANHRFGLYDAVLIKDNHIAAAGGIRPAVERVRGVVGHMVKIEVEVNTLDQLEQLLEAGADAVLLDNMDTETLRAAVNRINGHMIAEASGNITADTVREVAESGVDYISAGWITHSAPAFDVSLQMVGASPSSISLRSRMGRRGDTHDNRAGA